MDKLSVSEAREGFSELVNQVCYTGQRVVLHRHGKALAALVTLADLEVLENLENKIDLDEAKKALKESAKKGNVSWTKLKKELGL